MIGVDRPGEGHVVEPQRFTATVVTGTRGRVSVPLAFDPDAAWGSKPAHHLAGTVNGCRVRGSSSLSVTRTASSSDRPGGVTVAWPRATPSTWC